MRLGRLARIAAVLLTAGSLAAMPAVAGEVSGLAAANPQPAADALRPGLAVTYYYNEFNDTREITDWAKYKPGHPGEPIPMLDYWVGDGDVLTSGRADEVGAHIVGLIHLAKAGDYTFAMNSNDGVDLKIGGKEIIADTGVHPDRYSELVTVKVAQPGWYSLDLLYFEKRNTATLELFWLQPGESGQLNHAPADAFAHTDVMKAGG
jgi:hypothetical protein